MHLENGLEVTGTTFIPATAVTSRELFILQITQSLEGGFDTVNEYDAGILSWGVMQWTADSGNLAKVMLYTKNRLRQQKQTALWHKLFTNNGLDVDENGLEFYGQHALDPASLRVAVRGTTTVGNYDRLLAAHWATVLARAGMQPEIQHLQAEYASKVVDGVLQARLVGVPYHLVGRTGLVTDDMVCTDPYAAALVFVIWDNNPEHAWQYIGAAARATRAVSVSDDPSLWSTGAFSDALLRMCKQSKFGNWQQRAALIEDREHTVRTADARMLTPFEQDYQLVLTARKQRQEFELASRHMQEPGAVPSSVSHQTAGPAGILVKALETPVKSALAPQAGSD